MEIPEVPPQKIIKIYQHENEDGTVKYSIEGNIKNKDFCHEMLFQALQLVNNFHAKEAAKVKPNGHKKHRMIDFLRGRK